MVGVTPPPTAVVKEGLHGGGKKEKPREGAFIR